MLALMFTAALIMIVFVILTVFLLARSISDIAS
jgi:hypothetical protein